ncbi:MAG: hypothetical protein QXH55_04035 [Candidatus Korarchaeota archaeon]|nr:hypothetical protein [Thermoproteota archaeon]
MSNIMKLMTLGFLPPDLKWEDIELTIYYKIWEYFRVVCIHAQYSLNDLNNIQCKKIEKRCDFDACPVVTRALTMYQQALKYAAVERRD